MARTTTLFLHILIGISLLSGTLPLRSAQALSPEVPLEEQTQNTQPKRNPECASCRTRKENLCAKECAATPWEHQRHCRLTCINEYCGHKCSEGLDANAEISCDRCHSEETQTCAVQCTKGTPAVVNECKETCAKQRCEKHCS